MTKRELSLGIQTFENMIKGDYVYIDKTDLVYKLAKGTKFNFLSRPRRFGKSLLVTTLQSYFQGRQDLFKGLKIESLEKEWKQYPVLRFDLNSGIYQDGEGVADYLSTLIAEYEEEYEIVSGCAPFNAYSNFVTRFRRLIRTIAKQTGSKVVILIDEYEKPILESVDNPELQKRHRGYLKPFYSMLKTMEEHIHFVLITGVTRLSQLCVFSDLNNLRDISLNPEYATICGFTEAEVISSYQDCITKLCEKKGWSFQECLSRLRKKYDGYRFSRAKDNVYNPYSLLCCFDDNELGDYWFKSGTPSFLIHILRNCRFKLDKLEGIRVTEQSMTEVDDNFTSPVPLFYQSGYLTIVGYEKDLSDEKDWYTLDYPNQEVRGGFFSSLLSFYTQNTMPDAESAIDQIVKSIRSGDPKGVMEKIRSLIKAIPNSPREKYEFLYRDSVILILKMIGVRMQHEVRMLTGDIDCVIETPDFVYIIEFKVDKSVEKALRQIMDNDYASPYQGFGRKIFLIGVNFTTKPRDCTYGIL